ncbi:hypothetical protein ACHAWF_018005 [Thalassiosira exigua]
MALQTEFMLCCQESGHYLGFICVKSWTFNVRSSCKKPSSSLKRGSLRKHASRRKGSSTSRHLKIINDSFLCMYGTYTEACC